MSQYACPICGCSHHTFEAAQNCHHGGYGGQQINFEYDLVQELRKMNTTLLRIEKRLRNGNNNKK